MDYHRDDVIRSAHGELYCLLVALVLSLLGGQTGPRRSPAHALLWPSLLLGSLRTPSPAPLLRVGACNTNHPHTVGASGQLPHGRTCSLQTNQRFSPFSRASLPSFLNLSPRALSPTWVKTLPGTRGKNKTTASTRECVRAFLSNVLPSYSRSSSHSLSSHCFCSTHHTRKDKSHPERPDAQVTQPLRFTALTCALGELQFCSERSTLGPPRPIAGQSFSGRSPRTATRTEGKRVPRGRRARRSAESAPRSGSHAVRRRCGAGEGAQGGGERGGLLLQSLLKGRGGWREEVGRGRVPPPAGRGVAARAAAAKPPKPSPGR